MKSPCHNAGHNRAHNGLFARGWKGASLWRVLVYGKNPFLAVRGKNINIATAISRSYHGYFFGPENFRGIQKKVAIIRG